MRIAQLPVLARVAPFAMYLVVLALEGQAQHLFSEFDTRWLYPLKILLVVGVLATFRLSYTELRGFKFRLGEMVLSVGAGLLVFFVWVSLDAPWAVIGAGDTGYDPRQDGQIDWVLAGFRLAGAALVVPVMEELFWRSFLMRWWVQSDFLNVSPTQVKAGALLVSSVAFGFAHHQWLAGIFAGLVYAWLYRRTGHLYYPIIAHAMTNAALGGWVLMSGQWHYW